VNISPRKFSERCEIRRTVPQRATARCACALQDARMGIDEFVCSFGWARETKEAMWAASHPRNSLLIAIVARGAAHCHIAQLAQRTNA
jgi:hypothetical protein